MASHSAASHSFCGRQPWYETQQRVVCFHCDLVAMRTAWRGEHPGRRFLACKDQSCKFFRWCDPLVCERAKVIIPGLLKKVNKLEEESHTLELSLNGLKKKLKTQIHVIIALVVVCVFVVLLWLK